MARLTRGDTVAGRYRVERELGRGGMGIVYQATNIALDKAVALKVLHNLGFGDADEEQRVRRFMNEGVAASRVRHPAIVEIFDSGIDGELAWMALELLEGEPLRGLLERVGTLEVDEALFVMTHVLSGLAAAHEQGIVHRDVKPDNIFLALDSKRENVQPKLLDFGIAKLIREDSDRLTATAAVMGTAHYLSPEQAENAANAGAPADVYAAAVTLFESLSGRLPHEGEGFGAVVKRLFTEPPLELSEAAPELPEAVCSLVMDCLNHDLDARPAPAELAEALRELATDPTLSPGRVRVPYAGGSQVGSETLDGGATVAGPAGGGGEKTDEVGAAELWTVPPEEGDDSAGDTLAADPPRPPTGATTATRPMGRGGKIALVVVVTIAIAGAIVIFRSQTYESSPASREIDGSSSPSAPTGPPVQLGLAPTIDADVIVAELEPLRLYLEQGLDRPVTLKMTGSYGELRELAFQGAVDFAVMPPLLYTRTKSWIPDLVPIARQEIGGALEVDAILVVLRDSGLKTWSDLEGLRWCLLSRDSQDSYLQPRAFLRGEGHDPDDFMGSVVTSANHHQILRDLNERKCHVGATYAGAVQTSDQAGISGANLRQIQITGSGPHNVVVSVPDTPLALTEQMKSLLLAFDPEALVGTPYLGETRRLTGFRHAEMAPYRKLETKWRSEVVAESAELAVESALAAVIGLDRRPAQD